MTSDFSLTSLFFEADWIVKLVMIGLLICSVWSWTIIFNKIVKFREASRSLDEFEEMFWSSQSLEDLYDDLIKTEKLSAAANVFISGMKEWRISSRDSSTRSSALKSGIEQRMERVMRVTMGRELNVLERRLGFLASLGSTAPFIGLFATVLGIMRSFISIAEQSSTSLTVVAPGIAEALFATAMGLLAAIPAVIAFNHFSNRLGWMEDRLQNFSEEFLTAIARHIVGRTN